MNFGEWVQAQRTARGWSRQRLAEAMIATGFTDKASGPYIQQLERGEIHADKMGIDKAQALAAAFGVPAEAVLVGAARQTAPDVTAAQATLVSLGVTPDTLAALQAVAGGLGEEDWWMLVDRARRHLERRAQKERARQEREQARRNALIDQGHRILPDHEPPDPAAPRPQLRPGQA